MASQSTILVFNDIDSADINKLYTYHLAEDQTDVPQTEVPQTEASTENIVTQLAENIATPVDEIITTPVDEIITTPVDENITTPVDENVADSVEQNQEPDFRYAKCVDALVDC